MRPSGSFETVDGMDDAVTYHPVGNTTALRQTLALPRSPREQQAFDQAFTELRAMLPESELTTAFSRGESLSMEQIVALLSHPT